MQPVGHLHLTLLAGNISRSSPALAGVPLRASGDGRRVGSQASKRISPPNSKFRLARSSNVPRTSLTSSPLQVVDFLGMSADFPAPGESDAAFHLDFVFELCANGSYTHPAHSTPCALHPTHNPCPLRPSPFPLNPKLCALHPTPYYLHYRVHLPSFFGARLSEPLSPLLTPCPLGEVPRPTRQLLFLLFKRRFSSSFSPS